MKKLITLFIALFLLSANSRAVVVTIGTGTSTQRQPFGMYWGYERSASIYTFTEIGYYGSITTIAWYVGTAQATTVPTKIYLKTTTATTLTADTWANMIAGATLVYNATRSYTPTGWLTIDITDYTYSTDNLLVLCETSYGGTGTSSYPYFQYSTATNQHEYWYADNTPPTSTGTLNSNRPNIQFDISTSGCSGTPVPGNTLSSANPACPALDFTLSLQNSTPGTGVTYQWQSSPTNADPWTNGGTSGNYVTSQTAVTWYRCMVTCSGNTGTSTPLQVTLNSFSAPYTEEFTTWPPVCWNLAGGTNSWIQYSAGAVQCARANFWSQSSGKTDIMTTPLLDVSSMATPFLKFDWSHLYNSTYPIDGLDVQVSDNFGSTWTSVWTKSGATFNSADGAGNTAPGTFVSSGLIDLTAYGNSLLIKFIGNSGYGPDAFVDNVKIFQPVAHDVATVSIDMGGSVPPGVLKPKATVRNEGSNTETFPVNMTIGAYSSTITVTALAPGATQQVTFADWNATSGAFTVNVCTQLGTDLYAPNNCLSKTVSIKIPMYGFVAYAGTSSLPVGPAYFYPDNPGYITSLATATSFDMLQSGTWANGVWYGAEYYDNSVSPPTGGGWYTVNPADGAMTKLADMGRSYVGITYDHMTNTMYGVDYDDVNLTNYLYTIDPATGAGTLIGEIGPDELLINLATDGSGYLYSIGLGTDDLFQIDPAGPTMTDVGYSGIDFNYAQDMEYDYATNTMYAAGETSTSGGLYTVDLGSGACTLIGTFQGGAEVTGFAIPYSTVPENYTATGTLSGQQCYNATNTVTVGSTGTPFLETGTGYVTVYAGTMIHMVPNAKVQAGGYMLCRIQGSYCPTANAPMVAAETTGQEQISGLEQANFTIYPNPTTGNFTLVQKDSRLYGNLRLEIYSSRGEKVISENTTGLKKHEFRFADMPDGIYFVRIVADDNVETIKLVKRR